MDTLIDYVSFSAEQSFNQTYSFLSYRFYKIVQSSDIIAINDQINNILLKDIDDYNQFEQVEDMQSLFVMLNSFEDDEDICRVRLYVRDELIYASENNNVFPMETAKSSLWYEKMMASNEKAYFSPSVYLESYEYENNVVSIARTLKNRNNYNQIIGVLRLDMKLDLIQQILNDANPTDDSITYLVNTEGLIVASSDPLLLMQYETLDQSVHLSSQDDQFIEVWLGSEKVMLMNRLLPGTNWIMSTLVPYDSFIQLGRNLSGTLLFIILLAGIIAYSLAYAFSNSLTQRLSQLTEQMREIHQGPTSIDLEHQSQDEIGELFEHYNAMVHRVTLLVDEQYLLGQKLIGAELKALQSQINPHFLYNTLDMISWMSRMNRTSEINKVVDSLAQFYKLSLNKGADIVSIQDEITHITHYLKIQMLRFSNQITADIDVTDQRILNCRIPKITLQPLVENAIHHGILNLPGKQGHVWIKGKVEGDIAVLSIRDNGAGIKSERLEHLLDEHLIEPHEDHYGIRNINQRIHLFFGKPYGLVFSSTLGKGTTVEIRVPLSEIEENSMKQ